MPNPNFFIVGAPKCGTTSLYEYLRPHPEIFMPKECKEPYFFGGSKQLMTPNNYEKLFLDGKNKKRIGEASVSYLSSKKAALEIKEYDANAKIIIMLRNPVEVMYSLHAQCVFSGRENIKNFEDALADEENRVKKHPDPFTDSNIYMLRYRKIASYSTQVENYLQIFGKDNVHIVIYDDFKDDTDAEYKKILKFLDIDVDFEPNFKVHNVNQAPKLFFLQKLIHHGPIWWKKLRRKLIPLDFLRMRLKATLTRFNEIETKRKEMSPETRGKLIKEFTPEIEKLEKMLDRDLSSWKVL